MNNLLQRILTGILGAAIVIGLVWFNEWTYFGLFLLISFLCQWELYGIFVKNGKCPQRFFGLLTGIFLNTTFFLYESGTCEGKILFLNLLPLFFIFIRELFCNKGTAVENLSLTILGIIYSALPFALLHLIAFDETLNYQREIVLGILFLQWACDTGAYFVGKYLGKHKLWERISPKKTWEGSIGGLVACIAVSFALAKNYHSLTQQNWLVLSLIIGIISQFGDLAESAMKRNFQIKDSGSILPGHGGLLDRFDGLILAIPFVVVYFAIDALIKH